MVVLSERACVRGCVRVCVGRMLSRLSFLSLGTGDPWARGTAATSLLVPDRRVPGALDAKADSSANDLLTGRLPSLSLPSLKIAFCRSRQQPPSPWARPWVSLVTCVFDRMMRPLLKPAYRLPGVKKPVHLYHFCIVDRDKHHGCATTNHRARGVNRHTQ